MDSIRFLALVQFEEVSTQRVAINEMFRVNRKDISVTLST